jgi:hypothetical protein
VSSALVEGGGFVVRGCEEEEEEEEVEEVEIGARVGVCMSRVGIGDLLLPTNNRMAYTC